MCSWKVSNYIIAVGLSLVRIASCTTDKALLESGGRDQMTTEKH